MELPIPVMIPGSVSHHDFLVSSSAVSSLNRFVLSHCVCPYMMPVAYPPCRTFTGGLCVQTGSRSTYRTSQKF